jgi:CRP/FNR family transcriptional regulator, cyclic AMP receptor protein
MKTQSLARSLAEHPVVASLEPDHVEFLSGCTKNVRYAAKDYLFREGDEADHIYLVRQGKISLEIHAPQGTTVVETLHHGEAVGWSALFPPYQWHVDARAMKEAVVFAIDGACLRKKLQDDHSFGYAFTSTMLRVVHRRLERVRLQVLDVYGAK